MRKFRMFIDVQKEEKWLNEMIQKGWICQKVNTLGIYYFEKTKSPEQVIRIDFQSFKSTEMYQQYTQLHVDYGWQHIGGSRLSSSQYWCKSTDGLDELFSDNVSEKSYLQRLINYYGAFTFFFIILTICLFDNTLQYTSLKSAYFTPGLWDKEGIDFFIDFLFETPFALLRFSTPWFIIICGIVFMKTYMKHMKEFKKTA
ncbi:DUF2812 domain-containing protein [Lysinibacillus sp. NPDC097287]|uniref:DUF2812 domain-containing protein n=1 Tax=Lysinibacillus sp. NPDC097287 TaxID=3364144 RepID=UPI003828438F